MQRKIHLDRVKRLPLESLSIKHLTILYLLSEEQRKTGMTVSKIRVMQLTEEHKVYVPDLGKVMQEMTMHGFLYFDPDLDVYIVFTNMYNEIKVNYDIAVSQYGSPLIPITRTELELLNYIFEMGGGPLGVLDVGKNYPLSRGVFNSKVARLVKKGYIEYLAKGMSYTIKVINITKDEVSYLLKIHRKKLEFNIEKRAKQLQAKAEKKSSTPL